MMTSKYEVHALSMVVVGLFVSSCGGPVDFTNMSWAEFRAGHFFERSNDQEAFLVEGDIVVNEATLRDYYDAYRAEEIQTTQRGLHANAPFGSIDKRGGATIDYCFDDRWGVANGNVIDGFYVAPPLAPVMANVNRAARRWAGEANMPFRHRTDLDGPGCNQTLRYTGEIEFWVTHWGGTSATGAYPSTPNDFQQLRVPTTGISNALALHEVGHILGFRHEHERGEAAPFYCFDASQSIYLTGFDSQSTMMYANCTTSQAIGNAVLSRLDGVGARVAYGDPTWWAAGPWL